MPQPAPGPLHKISLASRRIGSILSRRLSGSLPPGKDPLVDESEFRTSLEEALRTAPAGLVASRHVFHLPANKPPWLDTGLDLQPGDRCTWFAAGRVYLSRALDVFVEPHFQLWARVGDGSVFSGSRASHSFTAAGGRLRLASYFPGEWSDPSGKLGTPESEYKNATGGLSVVLVRWNEDPLPALRRLSASGPARRWIDMEIDRLSSPVCRPDGWNYLWFLGDAEIYSSPPPAAPPRQGSLPAHEIHCCTRADVGILQYDLDAPLTPETRLAWSWRVDALPSAFAEDILLTHDYLSIAVEYDNGIDMTWYWSAELPVGTAYWCPLPTWKDREFHVVAQSGASGLGQWIDEDRNLYEEYRRFIGTPPARIRRVWLIANSLFQRLEGRCAYRDIRLLTPGAEHRVG